MPTSLRSIWSNAYHARLREEPETTYQPGARAPRGGLYWVSHLRHRLAHLVFVEEGTILPECRRCGGGVRYSLQQRVQHLEQDRDFAKRSRLLYLESRKGKKESKPARSA